MQLASTETFSVSFPDTYQRIQVAWESIRGEHTKGDEYLSFASISLQELNFYDKYEGQELLDRFRESCLEQRGIVKLIRDRTLSVAGLTSHIRTVKSPEGFFYYFGLLPIRDQYAYSFIGDCDTGSQKFYEPLFDEIWQTLQYFGNPATALEKQKAAIDAIFSKYQTNSDDNEEQEASKEIAPFVIPADEQEYWHIGEHSFAITSKAEVSVSEGDGALYVRIEGQAPGYIDQEESDIINDYEDGKVYFQFNFKGIYNAGIPTGKFKFENERDNTYKSYLWKGGFHYAQELTAEVTLEEGWLGINGYFNQYPVSLAVKLPTDDLDWRQYRFLTTDELSAAPPEIVRHLWLTDPYPAILQETLHPLTQLENLFIDFPANSKQAAGFKEVPKAVKRFKELKELSFSGVAELDSLPQWIGDLKKLEVLRLWGSQVEGIHPYIFQLPELKKLYLSDNRLGSIHQALPEKLDTLVVKNNQLKTVPTSVTRLKSLNIEDNPLEKLPDGLESIPTLNLELEKKMALLDYTYKGADGKGVVTYDDTRFLANTDPELVQILEEKIAETELDKYREGIVNRARKSIALETTEEDVYQEKGNHRFGGLPDLPPGISYPSFTNHKGEEKGLQFMAQINCADIAHLQDYLPQTGILYFFIKDQEELGPEVLYYDGDISQLQSAKDLNIDPEYIYDESGIYTPFCAEAGKYPCIPNLYNASRLYPELSDLEEMYDETEQLESALKSDTVNPVHSMNSYVFKQHDTPEIEAAETKKGKPEEWMVLLRISSDNNPGFNFWDAGEIYFVIHKSDLEKKDFSNVYCGLESS